MRTLTIILCFPLCVLAACSSSSGGTEGNTGGSTSGSGGGENHGSPSGSGGASVAEERAQIRFLYQPEWKDHLGNCASISDYRIKFGATPIPVSATIDTTPGALTDYVSVDGRTYADADVLHIFTCSTSQTSKDTLQLFGMFGTDLPLAPGLKYTVTLAGSTASVDQDL